MPVPVLVDRPVDLGDRAASPTSVLLDAGDIGQVNLATTETGAREPGYERAISRTGRPIIRFRTESESADLGHADLTRAVMERMQFPAGYIGVWVPGDQQVSPEQIRDALAEEGLLHRPVFLVMSRVGTDFAQRLARLTERPVRTAGEGADMLVSASSGTVFSGAVELRNGQLRPRLGYPVQLVEVFSNGEVQSVARPAGASDAVLAATQPQSTTETIRADAGPWQRLGSGSRPRHSWPGVDQLRRSSVVVDEGAEPWTRDEFIATMQRAGSAGRSVWFSSGDDAADARFRSEAELLTVGADEVAVHLEGRAGVAYHDGRPVPTDVLAAALASLEPTFSRVVLLICRAGRGDLVELPAELAGLGRPGVQVVASSDPVWVSTTTGTAVALTLGLDADQRPRTVPGTFQEFGQDSTSMPAGLTYPPNADLSADSGPYLQRLGEQDQVLAEQEPSSAVGHEDVSVDSRRGGVWSVWPAMVHGLDGVWQGVQPRAGVVVVVLPVAGDGRLGLVSADGSGVLPASAERVAAVVESALADPVVGADGGSAVQLIPVYPAGAGGVRDRGVLVESARALVERSGRHVYLPPLPGDSRPEYDLAAQLRAAQLRAAQLRAAQLRAAQLRAAQLPGGGFGLPAAGPWEGDLVPVPGGGVGRVRDVRRDGDCFVSALVLAARLQAPDLGLAGLAGASAETVVEFRREMGQAFRDDAELSGQFAGVSPLSMVLAELSIEQLEELRLRAGFDPAAAVLDLVDAGDLRGPVQELLEAGGSALLWEELAALFDGQGLLSLGDLVRELRADQAAGQWPDLAEMYARAIERTELWETPFGDVVPAMIARLRHPVIVLEQGRPPLPLGAHDDGREPLYILRTDSGGIGTAHYLALDPTTADAAPAGAGQAGHKRVRGELSDQSRSGTPPPTKRPRPDESSGSEMDISAESAPDHEPVPVPADSHVHISAESAPDREPARVSADSDMDMDISAESASDREPAPAPPRRTAPLPVSAMGDSPLTSMGESGPEESSREESSEESDGYKPEESDQEQSHAESEAATTFSGTAAPSARLGRPVTDTATADWVDPAGLAFQPMQRLTRPEQVAARAEIERFLNPVTLDALHRQGRPSKEMWASFRRSYEEQREAQSLQHLSRVVWDVVRRLEAEADQAGPQQAGADEETDEETDDSDVEAEDQTASAAAPKQLKREVEVESMLINGRLVIATNLNHSVTLLAGLAEALRSSSADAADRPLIPRLLDIEPRRAHGGPVWRARIKLQRALRGQRERNDVTDILAAADRLEVAEAEPWTADDFTRLRELLTDGSHRGSVILLRRSVRARDSDGRRSMHAELKLLLALHAARLQRGELSGAPMIRGMKRPCVGCWTALRWTAADLERNTGQRLRFNNRLGIWYRESTTEIVRHLPHVLRDPAGAEGNFVVSELRASLRRNGMLRMYTTGEDPQSGTEVEDGGRRADHQHGGATSSDSDAVQDADDVRAVRTQDLEWIDAFGRTTTAGPAVRWVRPALAGQPSRDLVKTETNRENKRWVKFFYAGSKHGFEYLFVDRSYEQDWVRPVADFGTLQVTILDPASGQPIQPPRTLFDSWMLDDNQQRDCEVDGYNRVRVGTEMVSLGVSAAVRRVRLVGEPPTDPAATTGTVVVHRIRTDGGTGGVLARVTVTWTPQPRLSPEQEASRHFPERVTGVEGGQTPLIFEPGFPHVGVVEHPTGVVIRVPGHSDGVPVGLAYDHGSGEAVAFDLDSHEVIGRRVAPPPPAPSSEVVRLREGNRLHHVSGESDDVLMVVRSYQQERVRPVADFGTLQLTVLDPASGLPVQPPRPLFDRWLLDHNQERRVDVDDRRWIEGRVRIGTGTVLLDPSLGGSRVLLRGHPASRTVAVHAIVGDGLAGAVLARVAVTWTPPPVLTPEQQEARHFPERVTGVVGGPTPLIFERGFPQAGVVEHPAGVVLRVPRRGDREPVGLAYDYGSGEAVAFDLDSYEVIERRVTPAPRPRTHYTLTRTGVVYLPGNDGNMTVNRSFRAPPGLTEAEAAPNFGTRRIHFFRVGTDERVGWFTQFPESWPTLVDGGTVQATPNRYGYVYAGPTPVRVDFPVVLLRTEVAKRPVVLVVDATAGRIAAAGMPARGTVTAYARGAGGLATGQPLARIEVDWSQGAVTEEPPAPVGRPRGRKAQTASSTAETTATARATAQWRRAQPVHPLPENLLEGEYHRAVVQGRRAYLPPGLSVAAPVAADTVVGVTYDHQNHQAVVFDLGTGQEISHEPIEMPAEARVSNARLVEFVTDGQKLRVSLRPALRGRPLVYDADFGSLHLRFIDPLLDPDEADQVVLRRTMDDRWLLDENHRRLTTVTRDGQVRVGTRMLGVGPRKPGSQVLLVGDPATGMVTAHRVNAKEIAANRSLRDLTAGPELGRIRVTWSQPRGPVTDPGLIAARRHRGGQVHGVVDGPTPFERLVVHAGIVDHGELVIRVPGVADDEIVGITYDGGSGEHVVFDLGTHAVLARQAGDRPAPPTFVVSAAGMVAFYLRPRKQPQISVATKDDAAGIGGRPVEVRPHFGDRTLLVRRVESVRGQDGRWTRVLHPVTSVGFPRAWEDLRDGRTMAVPTDASGDVHVGPLPVRVGGPTGSTHALAGDVLLVPDRATGTVTVRRRDDGGQPTGAPLGRVEVDWSSGGEAAASSQGSRGAGASTRGARGAGASTRGARGAGASTRGARGAGASTRGARGAGTTTRGARGASTSTRGSRGGASTRATRVAGVSARGTRGASTRGTRVAGVSRRDAGRARVESSVESDLTDLDELGARSGEASGVAGASADAERRGLPAGPQVWLGIEPDAHIAGRLMLAQGAVAVHGHGRDWSAGPPPDLAQRVRAAAPDAQAAVLLVCVGAEVGQVAANATGLPVWASPDPVFVSASGLVFTGAAVLTDGRLVATTAGRWDRYEPGGDGPVADPGPVPLRSADAEEANADPGPWQQQALASPADEGSIRYVSHPEWGDVWVSEYPPTPAVLAGRPVAGPSMGQPVRSGSAGPSSDVQTEPRQGTASTVAPSGHGIPGLPEDAAYTTTRRRGYLLWSEPVAGLGAHLTAAGRTHLRVLTAQPRWVPSGARVIEVTIAKGGAIDLAATLRQHPDLAGPGPGRLEAPRQTLDRQLWLPRASFGQATVIGVYSRGWRGTAVPAVGNVLQGRTLRELADGRTTATPARTSAPTGPRTSGRPNFATSYVLGNWMLRAVDRRAIAPARPIERWAISPAGAYLRNAAGHPYKETIGIAFDAAGGSRVWAPPMVDGRYVLRVSQRWAHEPAQTLSETLRTLPFPITPSTFFITVHDNGIGFGPAVEEPSRLTRRLFGDVRRIGARAMARRILQDETFQRARREHGDNLVWVLLAGTSAGHETQLADTLGVPGWVADSYETIVGPTSHGNRISVRMRPGEQEPRWHYVQPRSAPPSGPVGAAQAGPQVWVGVEPDARVAGRLVPHAGVVVHGHGRDWSAGPPPDLAQRVRAAAPDAQAAVLLVCAGAHAAQEAADATGLPVWASPDPVFVSATGLVFAGAAVLADGRLQATHAGRWTLFRPGGGGAVADPGPVPLPSAGVGDANADPGPWQERALASPVDSALRRVSASAAPAERVSEAERQVGPVVGASGPITPSIGPRAAAAVAAVATGPHAELFVLGTQPPAEDGTGTVRRGGDLAAFRTAARDRLREAGIDPDRPYDNQRPTYPAAPPRLAAAIRRDPAFRAGSADEVGEEDLSRLVEDLGADIDRGPVTADYRRVLVRLTAQLGWDGGPELTLDWLGRAWRRLERQARTVTLTWAALRDVPGYFDPPLGLRAAVARAGLADRDGWYPAMFVLGGQPVIETGTAEAGTAEAGTVEAQSLVDRLRDSDDWAPGRPVVLLADDAGRSVDGQAPLAWRVAKLLGPGNAVFGASGRVVPDPDGSLVVRPTRDPRADPEWSAFTADSDPTAYRLDHFLDLVWRHRSLILDETIRGEAYDLYARTPASEPLTLDSGDYLDRVAEIAERRPAGARETVQAGPVREPLSTVTAEGRLYDLERMRAFYSFRRAGSARTPVQQRVYLSPRPDAAPALMRALVGEVVDDPARYPGVQWAKIAGPHRISVRTDAVVIQTDGQQNAERVVQWLRRYEQAHPGTFQDATPLMTLEVMTGVATAAEPATRGSFGRVRSDAVTTALAETDSRGGGWEAFRAAARDRLREAGVDPARPHANLPQVQATAAASSSGAATLVAGPVVAGAGVELVTGRGGAPVPGFRSDAQSRDNDEQAAVEPTQVPPGTVLVSASSGAVHTGGLAVDADGSLRPALDQPGSGPLATRPGRLSRVLPAGPSLDAGFAPPSADVEQATEPGASRASVIRLAQLPGPGTDRSPLGYDVVEVAAARWMRPRVPAPAGEQAVEATIGALPAAAGPLIVAGSPGQPVPNPVIGQLHRLVDEHGPAAGSATRLLFVTGLTPQQRDWARQRAALGLQVVYPLGPVQGGPDGTLHSRQGWLLATADPAGTAAAGWLERELGEVFPPA